MDYSDTLFEEMVSSYIDCALWSSTDYDSDESLGANYSYEDISDKALERIQN